MMDYESNREWHMAYNPAPTNKCAECVCYSCRDKNTPFCRYHCKMCIQVDGGGHRSECISEVYDENDEVIE